MKTINLETICVTFITIIVMLINLTSKNINYNYIMGCVGLMGISLIYIIDDIKQIKFSHIDIQNYFLPSSCVPYCYVYNISKILIISTFICDFIQEVIIIENDIKLDRLHNSLYDSFHIMKYVVECAICIIFGIGFLLYMIDKIVNDVSNIIYNITHGLPIFHTESNNLCYICNILPDKKDVKITTTCGHMCHQSCIRSIIMFNNDKCVCGTHIN